MRGQPPAFTGIGLSAVGRKLGRDGLDLASEAILAAIGDAGLSPRDIDGLACWPGRINDQSGLSSAGVWDVQDAFGFDLNWYSGGVEGPAQMASIINAAAAIQAGYARHVVCFRASTESSSRAAPSTARIGDWAQWFAPFGAASLISLTALATRFHMEQFGTTAEQLGEVALNARRNAALNPLAVFSDPLSMDDYLASRVISTPLRLFDCDVPVDGAVAFVLSSAEAARDCRRDPIRLEGSSGSVSGRIRWDQRPLDGWAAYDAGRALWQRTDYRPQDVQVAGLYDGFSFLTLMWLEALGFCGHGESGAFVEGGGRIALGGQLPLATGGGQLSAGRLHGLGHLHEAIVQLRGEGGARQVAGDPSIAVVSNGAGPLASCALLVRE